MKREPIDYFTVYAEHEAIHARLENWAQCVRVGRFRTKPHPMWANSRSNARQWHAPEPRPTMDPLDGQRMEKAVYTLPEPNREAIRWSYVYQTGPVKACRALGVTAEGLAELVHQGRDMLVSRKV